MNKSHKSDTEIKTITFTVFDKLYFCFFLLLPFVYTAKVIDPVLLPRQLLLTVFLFIVGCIIINGIRQKKLVADFSFLKLPVFIAAGLFLATILLSFFPSIAITESLYVFSKIGIELLFFVLTAYLLIQQQLSFSNLVKAVIAFSLASLINALYQIIDLSRLSADFFDTMLNINATFGHKNLLASVLFLTFPFLFCAFNLEKKWKITAILAIVLSILIVWLVQTKAVVLAILIFSFILFLFFLKHGKQKADKKFIKKMVISVTVLITVASTITIINRQKFSRLFDQKSTFERLGLWENSWEMTKEHPVLGVGAGNWQVHFPKYGLNKFSMKDVKNGITTFQRPHNDFLWVLCEMGILGLVAYISVFVIILYYLIKLLQQSGETGWRWPYAAFFAAVINYSLIACIDFPLERIEHQLLLYLLFSIVVAQFYTINRKPLGGQITVLNFPILMALLFVPTFFSGIVCYKRYIGEYHTQRLYGFERISDWTRMNKESEKAMNAFYSMDPMSAPIQWYKGVALFSSGDTYAAKASFETAYALHPYNIHVINNLASCYEQLKEHDKAEETYQKALAISSEFEEARLNLSAVYYNMQAYNKAFETIDKCDMQSKDEKYQLFLPAILNSWLDARIMNEKNAETVEKLTIIKNTKDELITLYVESRKKGLNFKEQISKLTN
jgi:O-antigen ligase